MARKRSKQDKGQRFVCIKKMVTLAELVLHLGCSRRTVQRRLAYWEALRSYNRNGSYYTLPGIAKFDVHGLWRYHGVFFSRFGSLSETFAQLVANSPAGLTASEAGELLGLRPSSFLWSVREHPAVLREKHQGRYVYLCSDSARCRRQRAHRSQMQSVSRLPSDAEAVAILVEKIKHPALRDDELSQRLEKQRVFVQPELIHDLFTRHGLAVKKTPPSR